MLRSQFRLPRLHRSLHTTRLVQADASGSAQKAATPASATASKAAASAQEYAGKALEQSQKFAQVIGNTTGKLLANAGPRVNGIVDRIVGLQKPIVYWGKVTVEVAKQVYLKEKMALPSGAEFQETFNVVRQQLMKPDALFKRAMEYTDLAKLQAVGWQPLVRGGLKGIELFGFFVVGEMIGRRSLKGYKV